MGYGKRSNTPYSRSARIELGSTCERAEKSSTQKPFDVLAEGLISENSRGDKTAIELFLAGVGGWDAGLSRRMVDSETMAVLQ